MKKKDFLKKLNEVPQKYEDFGTITYQMKLDIFKNFTGKNYSCVEIGCYKGYTTNMFSNIFKNVLALDNDSESLEYAKNNNRNNNNVLFEKIDLYNQPEWNNIFDTYQNKYEVALVDANHSYKSCKSDVINAIKLGCKYIILDDVGVYDGIKQVVNEISEEYSTRLKAIHPIGIDWNHYSLPVLNIPVYCIRLQEINVGYSNHEFTWILRDKTDIDINNGKNHRPMYDSMNINLQVARNYVEYVSGHVSNNVKFNTPDLVVPINNSSIPFFQKLFFSPDMTLIGGNPSFNDSQYEFTPFPHHRFNEKQIMSLFSEDSLFDKDNTNYEGSIIELK